MKFQSFKDIYQQLVNEAYQTEKRNYAFLPKVIERVHSQELKKALNTYYSNLKQQHQKWEHFLQEHKMQSAKAPFCPIDALVTHLETCMRENQPSALLDAIIIHWLQQIEHVTIATLGTLKAFSHQMGEAALKNWLQTLGREEMRMDAHLTKLALGEMGKQGLNQRAA